jgi:hypothetical protein
MAMRGHFLNVCRYVERDALWARLGENAGDWRWASMNPLAMPSSVQCSQKERIMPGETDLHKTLKKEACRWLHRVGYRCVAAEVKLPPVGIIDAVGTGMFGPSYNHLHLAMDLQQVCFVECKASRSDFLRDLDHEGRMLFELSMAKKPRRAGRRRRKPDLRGLGKFKACLLRPQANIHYVLAPAGLLQKKDLPVRWGLLSYGEGGISVVHKAQWVESANTAHVESAIARTLTADIYNADFRALNSVNREIFAQQEQLAGRIRGMRPQIVLVPQNQPAASA